MTNMAWKNICYQPKISSVGHILIKYYCSVMEGTIVGTLSMLQNQFVAIQIKHLKMWLKLGIFFKTEVYVVAFLTTIFKLSQWKRLQVNFLIHPNLGF